MRNAYPAVNSGRGHNLKGDTDPMNLTVQQVFDATPILANIIRENRPLPQRGSYRLARMHAKLLAEWQPIAARYDALIVGYDHKEPGADLNSVPSDKMDEFRAKWAEIAGETIDVDVDPIPLACLDLGDAVAGSLTASELATLGDLVAE